MSTSEGEEAVGVTESARRRLAVPGTILGVAALLGCGEAPAPSSLALESPVFCSDATIFEFVAHDGSLYVLHGQSDDTTLLRTDHVGNVEVLMEDLPGAGARLAAFGPYLQWHQVSQDFHEVITFDRERDEVVDSRTFREAVEVLGLEQPDQMVGAGTIAEPTRILISDAVAGVLAADLASEQSVVVAPPENRSRLALSSSSAEGTALSLLAGEVRLIGDGMATTATVATDGANGVLAGADGVLYENGGELELFAWDASRQVPLGVSLPEGYVGFVSTTSDYQDEANWALIGRDPESGAQKLMVRLGGQDRELDVPADLTLASIRVDAGESWALRAGPANCIAPVAQE